MIERVAILETKIDSIHSSVEELKAIRTEVKHLVDEVQKIRLELAGKQGVIAGIGIGISLVVSCVVYGIASTGKHLMEFFK